MTPVPRSTLIRSLALAVFCAGVLAVVALSLLPQQALPHFNLWDKAQHLVAYLCLALAGGMKFRDWRSLLALGLGLVALGVGLEVIQWMVPGRQPSRGDIVANTLGVAMGLTIARFAASRIRLFA